MKNPEVERLNKERKKPMSSLLKLSSRKRKPEIPPVQNTEDEESRAPVPSNTTSVLSTAGDALISHVRPGIGSNFSEEDIEPKSKRTVFSRQSFMSLFASKRTNGRNTVELPVYEAGETEISNVNLGKNVRFTNEAPKNRNIKIIFTVLFFVGVVVAITVAAITLNSSEEQEANGNDNEPVCGSSLEEAELRRIIANNLENGTIANLNLGCIPSNALNDISEKQLDDIKVSKSLTFQKLGITQIDVNAFQNDFDTVTSLSFTENGISSLPNNVFDTFSKLEIIDLSNNAFVKLDNAVFENLQLEKYIFSGNSFIEFPKGIKNSQNVTEIDFTDCKSLLNVEPLYFVGSFPNLVRLFLENTNAFAQYGDESGFRDVSGLSSSVNITF